MQAPVFADPAAVSDALDAAGYLPEPGIATAAYLAIRMNRPLFVEGDPGAGKTALAHALATITGARLVRLQCYEGIDASQALYDWDFPRQILHLRAAADTADPAKIEASLYDRRFLVARPILQALESSPSVLLLDEIDRADDEFEAFLLEVLAENSVTIPELGTIAAEVPPLTVITSNRTREVHDALKRRCLYLWLGHPGFAREVAIVRRRLPDAAEQLVADVAGAVARLREFDLLKPPGVAETIDWTRALDLLGATGARSGVSAGHPGRGAEIPRGHRPGGAPVGHLDRGRKTVISSAAPPSSEGHSADPVVIMTGFARALRASGVAADTSRLASAVEALSHVDLADTAQVYWAGRITLCAEPDDLPRYDAAFDEWFLGGAGAPSRSEPAGTEQLAHVWAPEAAGEAGSPSDDIGAAATDAEILRHRDIAELSAAEREEINRLIGRLAPRVGSRRTRRYRAGGHRQVDLHRTVRAMLRDGGETGTLAHRRAQVKPRRLVFLIDVSGSMSPYADLLLRFAHAAVRVAPLGTEAFTAGTRLTRVTRQLRIRDPAEALRAAGLAIPDWSGGTRLGESLRAFLDLWGQRGTARQAIVIIASDGWERGDSALLAGQMRRLSGLAYRVLWVNPHRGRDGFEPITAGMAAALPYVDELLPGHNVDALHSLAEVIWNA